MEKSYKSFKEIINTSSNLSNFLENYEQYLAHTSKIDEQEPETLIEHVTKVNDYFLLLCDIHGLDSIVDKMINTIHISNEFQNQKLVGDFIKTLFVRSIIFHDYGKVNPNFQVFKMKNNIHFKQDKSIKIGSNHSSLSAYIFIHWHLKESFDEIEKQDLTFIWACIFLFATPIFKHHSKFLKFEQIPFTKEQYQDLERFIEVFKIQSKIPLENSFEEKFLNTIFSRVGKHQDYDLFSLFALLKLNFSLLTASDYYATFDYTNGNSNKDLALKPENFGIITQSFRKRIIQNFKTTRDYNTELFEKTEELKNIPFESLKEQSNSNLNKLRQKLAAEALMTIRTHPNSSLFYLEAPTGGGKTNVSLALATQLLEQDEKLNKIFYVFPFTTLITQTFEAIKETLAIENKDIIQLHAKSGFHQANEEDNDGNYGENRMNFIANHFINYPITLLTHIKFFDVLKGNDKENNYIFHRLANSIVIIDELQTYNPKHWDKVIFFLSNYARLFNMKIILMSATLPKIDDLLDKSSEMRGKVIHLIRPENKTQFFQNPNFSGRVEFDFSLLEKQNWKRPKRENEEEKEVYLQNLATKILQESEKYALTNSDSVRTLVEFITKKTASRFLKHLQENENFENYVLYLISGEILDPRRKEIIQAIKSNKDKKVILITTQVVEAGVDIDMDLGFKDRSLIDSDEQLAGRVNRNASKKNCKVFMFDFDSEAFVYRNDERLKVDAMSKKEEYKVILKSKNFDTDFYDKVKSEIIKTNQNDAIQNLTDYTDLFRRFDFHSISRNFKLIEEENESVFIPLPIPKEHFSEDDLKVISYFEIEEELKEGKWYINGEHVWKKYVEILSKTNQDNKQRKNYIENQVLFKQIYGVLSKFMFSAFSNQIEKLKSHFHNGEGFNDYKGFGIHYFSHWEKVYNYENGLDMEKVEDEGCFL